MSASSKKKIAEVVDHVRSMAAKYDFTPDEQTAPDAVSESANQLGIVLSASEHQSAVYELTD